MKVTLTQNQDFELRDLLKTHVDSLIRRIDYYDMDVEDIKELLTIFDIEIYSSIYVKHKKSRKGIKEKIKEIQEGKL